MISTITEKMSTNVDRRLKNNFLSELILNSPEFKELKQKVEAGRSVISIDGMTALPARALAVALLQSVTNRSLCVITANNNSLERWERDLHFWQRALEGEIPYRVLALPASESDIYAGVSPHTETLERRALTLWSLVTGKTPNLLLTTARAISMRTVTPAKLIAAGAILNRDAQFNPEELVERMISSGYVRAEPVTAIGEFSVRGGIVDAWSPGVPTPVRIEFFGDLVDSIRTFDPETQLSTGQIEEAEIVPMREYSVSQSGFRRWAESASQHFGDERFTRALSDRTIFACHGESFPGWEWLIPLTLGERACVFKFIDKPVLIIDEPGAIEHQLQTFYSFSAERYAETLDADELALSPETHYLSPKELRAEIDPYQRIELRALGRDAAKTDVDFVGDTTEPLLTIGRERKIAAPLFLFPVVNQDTEIEWISNAGLRYHGRIASLCEDLKRNRTGAVFFAMPSLGVAERIREMLREYGINPRHDLTTVPRDKIDVGGPPGTVIVTGVGRLSSGFVLPKCGLTVHVEGDLFDEISEEAIDHRIAHSGTKQALSPSRKVRAAAFLSDFRDLKVGDYVVHVDHGVARFGGLQTLDLRSKNGQRGEFMLLYYADDARLYVPVERLDLVQRYASSEVTTPQLDRLGGLGWQKTKARAKRAMRDMADELLRLYAERKLVSGHAFPSDMPWQVEFEEAFEYLLTPDQAAAIEDVKRDMQSPVPMDRLLCGDVGYGKTEVAMRAAFKSVLDSRQVTVLAPTTVLAYQHYSTFRSRFVAFPVKIELLSRLRSPKEQKEIVKQIASAGVDIIIGTHRILSRDISFHDLGLVIIDEEQRFGVAHKELLKKMKKRVDVLTLSATPIPRTLNMSIAGLRDMSVIETPPRDRLAIQTQVVQFSEKVVKSAIELELGRSGQVFFIHNRVESIDTIAALIKRLVPAARVVVAHGQMNEREMETQMLDFVDYKYDVLVATTIIENGIDIPRANTIIINRADNYGLSQLYQLRGRVGRSNRRAYAYLLIPGEATLSAIARRRLAAIREFSDLGAGFRIAALDLELRGAGNFLGREQSGHLDSLGFDLYVQMLERTVAELKGEAVEDEIPVTLNLGMDLSIPGDYISEMGQRLRTYKRIASARDDQTLTQIRAELEDRYGELPEEVESLLDYQKLRRLAEKVGVLSIDRTADGLALKFSEKAGASTEKLFDMLRVNSRASFTPNGILRIRIDGNRDETPIQMAHHTLLEVSAVN